MSRTARLASAATILLAGLVSGAPVRAAEAPAKLPTAASGVATVALVVDISGSMNDEDPNGTTKLNGAKQGIVALLDQLPTEILVSLRAYPAGTGDCGEGVEIAAPFTKRGEVGRLVRSLEADGGTPTGPALEAAYDDLRRYGLDGNASIVLVSDGESNCGRDPCEVAKELLPDVAVKVHTIGFQIDGAGKEQLQCISTATDGKYLDADNADELAASLGSLAGASFTLDVDGPGIVFRNIGIDGQSPTVTLSANITNMSPNLAANVRVQITPTSDEKPFLYGPVQQLGNIEPFNSKQQSWTFAPALDFTDKDLTFKITVSAANAVTVSRDISVKLRGEILMDDVGPLLAGKERVVILGDSYSAGEGAGGYPQQFDWEENACHRSDATYGAALWPVAPQRINLACSGAVSKNLTQAQNKYTPPQISQLNALKDAPDLVLLTLGGNDADFAGVAITCLLPGECYSRRVVSRTQCLGPGPFLAATQAAVFRDVFKLPGTLCVRDHGNWGEMKMAQASAIVPQLVDSYLRIDNSLNSPPRLRARGGPAPMIVLAYPNPVPDPSRYNQVIAACPGAFSYEEWKWLNRFVRTLNSTIETAVNTARSQGVPIYFAPEVGQSFEPAHTACDTDKYLNYLDLNVGAVGGAFDLIAKTVDLAPFGTSYAFPPTTPQGRKKNELFHPNANGYRAMTAALVQFSNSQIGQHPVERNRPAQIEVLPIPVGPTLEVETLSGTTLGRGQTLTVIAPNLLPGSTADLAVESTPQLLATSVVADDGTATLQFDLPANFDVGAHTVTVTGFNTDGVALSSSYPVTVADPRPFWDEHGVLIALSAAGTAAASGGWLGLALFVRRRLRIRSATASAG